MSGVLDKTVQNLRNRIYLLIGRAVLAAVNDAGKRQRVQITALKGETKDSVERIQEYGFTSVPLSGAQVLFASICGNRDHPVVFAVDDPRYRLNDLQPGEVAIYDHLGTYIKLQTGNQITMVASTRIRMETPVLEVTGDIIDRVDEDGQSMHNMREVYNIHEHPENDGGGPTDEPNEKMGTGGGP